MQLTRPISLLSLLPTLITALAPTHLVYEAPKGTWFENLAVRACGSILLSTTTSPDLWLLDPFSPTPTPTLLHRFASGLETLGITETAPDTFHVAVANASLKTNTVHTVSFPPRSDVPDIHLAATIPEAGLLNGLVTLNPTTILAADSYKGVVWAIDVRTGASRPVLSDPLMAPVSNASTATDPLQAIGINGVKLHGRTLYFTNTALALFAKIAIRPDGTAFSAAEAITHAPSGTTYDDFALDDGARGGDAFLTTAQGNTIVAVGLGGGGRQGVVAGDLNSTEIAEPTAAGFGRTVGDADVLYVTTGGGLEAPVNGDEVMGGQVVAVDTKGWGGGREVG